MRERFFTSQDTGAKSEELMLIGLVERRGPIKKWQKREEAMNLDAWGRDTRGQKVSCPDKEGTPQSCFAS